MSERNKREVIFIGNYDSLIFISVILLVLFGVAMVFSSSYYTASTSSKYGYDMFYFLKKQLRAVAVGGVGFVAAMSINYRFWKRFSFPMYIAANLLLVYVKFFGSEVNGAKRWIDIPMFGSFQPSEFAKVALVIFMASIISEHKDILRSVRGVVVCGMIILLPCLLVLWGNNLSTALILIAIGGAMIFIASPHFWIYIATFGGGVAALVTYLAMSSGFRGGRWDVWKDPWIDPMDKGFQNIQSLYAVASGGLFGLGLGQSRQKLAFMPEPHNDFIFAIICEELGFFGALLIIILFGVLVWRGFRVALTAQDMFGSLIAAGAVVLVGVQVLINIAVVTKTIPNTGIPLPFISYGGTSILFILFLMGVLVNISRYQKGN